MKLMHPTLAFSLVSVLLMAACTPTITVREEDDDSSEMTEESSSGGPYIETDESSSESEVVIDISSKAVASSKASTQTTTSKATKGARTIPVTVTNWSFSPATLTAKKGEKVKLQISGGEGIHGFASPGLGLNIRVEAGKTVTVDLPTTVAGTFDVFCSIPCGSGHRSMKATIVITE